MDPGSFSSEYEATGIVTDKEEKAEEKEKKEETGQGGAEEGPQNPLWCYLCLGVSKCPYILPCEQHIACHTCLHNLILRSTLECVVDAEEEEDDDYVAQQLLTHVVCPLCKSGPFLEADLRNCAPIPAPFRALLEQGIDRSKPGPLISCPYGCPLQLCGAAMYRHVGECTERKLQCVHPKCTKPVFSAVRGYIYHVREQCTAIVSALAPQGATFSSWKEYQTYMKQEKQRQSILKLCSFMQEVVNRSKGPHICVGKEAFHLNQLAALADAVRTARHCRHSHHVSPNSGLCKYWDEIEDEFLAIINLHASSASTSSVMSNS